MLKRRAKQGPIGLDIGTSSIKLLQFSDENGRPALIASAHYPLRPVGSDPAERALLIERAVADAFRRHPFQGRAVVSALGLREFQMKNIRLPRMPEEELASAVTFEAEDRFDLAGRNVQYRYMTAGEVRHGNELKKEIIVFAAPDEDVLARLSLLEACKLKPVALDISPCAVARSFIRYLRRAEDARAVHVFMDIGRCGTSIVITRGTELMFLKVIDIGGERFNSAVAKMLNIPVEEAAELRVRIIHGQTGRRTSDKGSVAEEVKATVSDAVRPLIERIARDVQLCLRYFAVTFRGQRPESLTLVGGEAHEPSLNEIIGETVDTPCIIGDPLRGVDRAAQIGGGEHRTFRPAWAVACGLALWGSRWTTPHDVSVSSGAVRSQVASGDALVR